MEPIYLDNHATTHPFTEVIDGVKLCMDEVYGNASSKSHSVGRQAAAYVEKSRAAISSVLQCQPNELHFTSGATESNNTIIKGIIEANFPRKNHLIVSAIEHSSVLRVAEYLQEKGIRVTLIPVDNQGFVDPAVVENSITPQTALVSIQAANSEIGTKQPIAEIAKICLRNNVDFHTDATQLIGKEVFNSSLPGISFVSGSAHKFHGPKGVGFLVVNDTSFTKPIPLLHGGNQESGMRSGTINVPGVYGMSIGLQKSIELYPQSSVQQLRDYLFNELDSKLQSVNLVGPALGVNRLAFNLNVAFEDVQSEQLMRMLPDVCLSTGSACSSAENVKSHVLRAINSDSIQNIRIGLSYATTKSEIIFFAKKMIDAVTVLRSK